MDHHTPGSWEPRIMEMSKKDWAALNCGPIQVVCRGQDVIAAVWCGDDRNTTEAANAHLIAAAPDLLAELRRDLGFAVEIKTLLEIYKMQETVQYHSAVMREESIRAAIAKAEDRS